MKSSEVFIYEIYRMLEKYYSKRKTIENFFEYLQIKTASIPLGLIFTNSSRESIYGGEILKKVEKVFKTMNFWKLVSCKKKKKHPIKTKAHMVCVRKKIKDLWKKRNFKPE